MRAMRGGGETVFFFDVRGLREWLAGDSSGARWPVYLMALWVALPLLDGLLLLLAHFGPGLEVAANPPAEDAESLEAFAVAWRLAQAVGWALGVLWCFVQNGGVVGRAFHERYLALVWVCGVRVYAVLWPLSIAVGLTGLVQPDLVALALDPLALVLITLLAGRHLRHLAAAGVSRS